MRLALNLVLTAGLIAIACIHGLLTPLWEADQTHLTKLIVVIWVAGILICGWKLTRIKSVHTLELAYHFEAAKLRLSHDIGIVKHIASSLVVLGLIGTVIGFIIALSGVDPDSAGKVDAITPMVASLLSGMSTALYTTLVGALTSLHLGYCYRILAGRAVAVLTDG